MDGWTERHGSVGLARHLVSQYIYDVILETFPFGCYNYYSFHNCVIGHKNVKVFLQFDGSFDLKNNDAKFVFVTQTFFKK